MRHHVEVQNTSILQYFVPMNDRVEFFARPAPVVTLCSFPYIRHSRSALSIITY